MSGAAGSRPRRVLLKLSGEGLAGPGGAVDPAMLDLLARDLRTVLDAGTQVGLVVGGGNFLRGKDLSGVPRVTGDRMGMLATVLNGLALEEGLRQRGVGALALSAVPVGAFCEVYRTERCVRELEAGRVAILVGGTGNPFFSTDSAAALRACEVGAEVLLKATQVDGVFSADPHKDPAARRYDALTWQEVIEQGLQVMDLAAVVLCQENRIPIRVFHLHQEGNLVRACAGEAVGTLVGEAAQG